MSRALLVTCLCVVLPLLGCGTEVGRSAADAPKAPAASDPPTELTCPSGEMVGSDGGFLSKWPEGADDPDSVVAAARMPGETWVRVGKRAYVLRSDGTAFEVHDLVHGPKGWFLQGYEACAD